MKEHSPEEGTYGEAFGTRRRIHHMDKGAIEDGSMSSVRRVHLVWAPVIESFKYFFLLAHTERRTSGNRRVIVCLQQYKLDQTTPCRNLITTHISFHVALPSAALNNRPRI